MLLIDIYQGFCFFLSLQKVSKIFRLFASFKIRNGIISLSYSVGKFIFAAVFHIIEDRLLQDEVISVLPIVQNVNAMTKDMDKPVKFDMLLVSPEARGFDSGRTEVI